MVFLLSVDDYPGTNPYMPLIPAGKAACLVFVPKAVVVDIALSKRGFIILLLR